MAAAASSLSCANGSISPVPREGEEEGIVCAKRGDPGPVEPGRVGMVPRWIWAGVADWYRVGLVDVYAIGSASETIAGFGDEVGVMGEPRVGEG